MTLTIRWRCATAALSFALAAGISAHAAQVQEIPVTTASAAARLDFEAGQAAADRGDAQRANALFKHAVTLDPGFAYAWLNLANTSLSAQEFNSALETARRNGASASEGERLLVDIGLTFIDNDADKRLELSRRLVEQYPASPRAWLNLGFALGGLNRNEEARDAMRKAEQLAPDMPLVHTSLGFNYLFGDPKDYAKARDSMEAAVRLEPGEDNYHVNVGDVHRGENELEAANAAYQRAVNLDPQNGIALLKLAHINSFLGSYDEARRNYDAGIAVATEQNRATYANFKMFTYLHAGDIDGAIGGLNRLAADVDSMDMPDDQRIGARILTYTNLAQVALHGGRYDEGERAIAGLAAALRANAQSVNKEEFTRNQEATIAYWEGQLAARRGDYAAALRLAKKNKELVDPDANPRKLENYHEVLGLVHLLQKDYAKAAAEYRQANLTVMYTKYHLALALEGAGQRAEARALYKEVGEWNFNTVDFALVRRDALSRATA
jgi:tetratricopeptide (TPR) repeat protein